MSTMENEPIKITVIMPMYNAERFIRKSVESIINQTYKNIEFIIVNDGSKDASADICAEYAASDDRIKIIDKENGGICSARNAGMDVATGDYLIFADADDYMAPNECEKIADAAYRHDADIVVFNYKKVDFDGNEVCKIKRANPLPLPTEETVWNNSELCKRMISFDSEICGYTWNKLEKRSFIGEKRFVYGLKDCEDLLFNQNLIERDAKIVYVPDELYYYVYNPQSVTNVIVQNMDELIIASQILESVENHFPEHMDMALRDFAERYIRIAENTYKDSKKKKTLLKIGRQWKNKLSKCPGLRKKIKLYYRIITVSPRLFFDVIRHIKG